MTRIAIMACCLLAGCGSKSWLTRPIHTETQRDVYVSIPASLTAPEKVDEQITIATCPTVAAQRRKALESCNAKLNAIRTIEGTPVTNEDQQP